MIRVDISTLKSKSSIRDSAIKSQWLESKLFPEAVFKLDELVIPNKNFDSKVEDTIVGKLSIREIELDNGIVAWVDRYSRSQGSGIDGVYYYNFCLNTDPLIYQPSGAVNLSKINTVNWSYILETPLLKNKIFPKIEFGDFIIKLVDTKSELKKAQALRYSVFYKEKKARPTFPKKMMRLDYDKIDKFADHLIVCLLYTSDAADE